MRVTRMSPPSVMQTAIGVLITMPLCTATFAFETTVVVTDHLHPVHHADDARVIELDAPSRIEATLAVDLPTDPPQAVRVVQQRLKDGNGELARQLAAAYQGVVAAWNLGVTTIPAVIVDRHYVVYGDTDVPHAVARVQAYREAHP